MRIILFGAPGSGKGTQAEVISGYYHIKKVSLGDILRAEVKSESTLGKKVKTYMDRGVLVPDEVVKEVIEQHLGDDGFVLDGYPRNIPQAEHLDTFLKSKGYEIDKVIYLSVSEETVLNRLQLRRVCKRCGALYHLVNLPPRQEGVCDKCGGELIQRNDDTPEVIKERLAVFAEESKPLLDFYRRRGVLVEVDANRSKDEVFAEIKKILGNGEHS